jgi:FKBP-type peptidyl-prolyl cis-trans isomerase FkpA
MWVSICIIAKLFTNNKEYMKKLLFILSICAITNYSYGQASDYKKAGDGLEYKIIRNGSKNILQQGQYLELHFINLLSHNGIDTVLNNTRAGSGAQVMGYDSVNIPPTYFNIFKEMNEGDSLCTRTLVDSVFKQGLEGMPKYMKLGDYLCTNISIINVYKTKAEADVVIKKNQEIAKEAAALKVKFQAVDDDLSISNYIISNNIKATKLPSGVYVSISQEGTGPIINDKQIVKIMYRGKTLKGVVFDTNMDDSKGHQEPLTVNVTKDRSLGNGVIQGMVDALYAMKKGTKGSMFIPSGLAYGPRGAGGDIGPDENMIFDIEILSTQTIEQFKAEQAKGAKMDAAKETVVAEKKTMKNPVQKKKIPSKKAPIKTVKKVVKKK